MARIKLTKKDINKAFSDALDTGQLDGQKTGLAGAKDAAVERIRQMIGKKKETL